MTHQHPGYGTEAPQHAVHPPRPCVEIGVGVCISPSYHWRPDQGETEADRRIVGYVIAHDTPEWEERCESALLTELGFGPTAIWTQTGSLEGGDLSLSPSVQCRTHSAFHAFVQNGRWTG